MARNKIHISLIIAFTVLFLVFNIGLPVVLHYCEMMETVSRDSCGMCHTEKNGSNKIELAKTEPSCCQAIIAADRNASEFLQAQKNEVTKLQYFITPSTISGLHASPSIDFSNSLKIYLTDKHSPPLIEDIPIFISSLLI